MSRLRCSAQPLRSGAPLSRDRTKHRPHPDKVPVKQRIISLRSMLRCARDMQESYTWRATIMRLISAIALAGLRCFGHALAQFMMVWQR